MCSTALGSRDPRSRPRSCTVISLVTHGVDWLMVQLGCMPSDGFACPFAFTTSQRSPQYASLLVLGVICDWQSVGVGRRLNHHRDLGLEHLRVQSQRHLVLFLWRRFVKVIDAGGACWAAEFGCWCCRCNMLFRCLLSGCYI